LEITTTVYCGTNIWKKTVCTENSAGRRRRRRIENELCYSIGIIFLNIDNVVYYLLAKVF